jgi:hypothetical protein
MSIFELALCLMLLVQTVPAAFGGSISGGVHPYNNRYTPISGATVEAYISGWNFVASGMTDVTGIFLINDPASGSYYLHTSNSLG